MKCIFCSENVPLQYNYFQEYVHRVWGKHPPDRQVYNRTQLLDLSPPTQWLHELFKDASSFDRDAPIPSERVQLTIILVPVDKKNARLDFWLSVKNIADHQWAGIMKSKYYLLQFNHVLSKYMQKNRNYIRPYYVWLYI